MAAVTDALKSLSSGCSAQVLCTRSLANVLFSPTCAHTCPRTRAARGSLPPPCLSVLPRALLQPLTAREPAQMYPDPTQTHFRSVSYACTCGCVSVSCTCKCTHARMHASECMHMRGSFCARAYAQMRRQAHNGIMPKLHGTFTVAVNSLCSL